MQDRKFVKSEGIGSENGGNKLFPPELMRRRWSQKEIVTVVCDELTRNGKLKQAIMGIVTTGDNK